MCLFIYILDLSWWCESRKSSGHLEKCGEGTINRHFTPRLINNSIIQFEIMKHKGYNSDSSIAMECFDFFHTRIARLEKKYNATCVMRSYILDR